MAASPSKVLYCAPFHRLEPLLAPALRRLAGGDPLRPRRVILISNLLRDHLHERLAREGGFAGVAFLTPLDLAREIAGARLRGAGLRPLPPLGGAALAGRVIREAQGELRRLRPPAGAEGYGEALLATLSDLEEALIAPADLARLAPRAREEADREWLADLARLAGLFEERLRGLGFYGEGAFLRAACEEAEARPPRVPTLLYGFADLNALQRRLLAACCRGAEGAAFVPAEPEAPACAFARPLIEWLRSQGFAPGEVPAAEGRPLEELGRRLFGGGGGAEPPEGALCVVSAPTPSREAFELCREVLYSGAEGPEAREAAVMFPGGDVYPRLFRETLRALGAPAAAEGGEVCAATPAGRAFPRMLSLRERNYPRAEVMRLLDEGRFTGTAFFEEMLRSGKIPGEGADPLLPSRWEHLSRGLPFPAGEEGWGRALSKAKEKAGEAEERSLIEGLEGALAFLFGRLRRLPARALPSRHASECGRAFEELTGEVEGRAEVLLALGRLADLDPLLGEVDARAFQRWAGRVLAHSRLRAPGGPARVRLLSLQAARGLSFWAVAVPGLAEGIFPGRGGEDPLLSDGLRAELDRLLAGEGGSPGRLPLKGDRTAEERYLFWSALLAAERRVALGVPLAVGGAGEDSERPPSLLLHHLVAAAGRPGEESGGVLERVPGHRPATAALDPASLRLRPVSLLEGELSGMLRQLKSPERGALAHLAADPGFARRRAALGDRWRRGALTAQDGLFAEIRGALRSRLDPGRRPVAVTDLETFFTCPYRFALRRLLRLERREEPVPPLEADPLLRGRIFHDALRRLFGGLRESGGALGEEAAWRPRLARAVEGSFRRFEEEGEALLPLAWRLMRESVHRQLAEFLRRAYVKEEGWTPLDVEGEFGRGGAPPLEIPLGEGAGPLLLSGRFDLLERSASGEHRFVDFKSGRSAPKGSEPLGGGGRLQPHLYARHGLRVCGEGARVGGAYAYVSEAAGFALRALSPEEVRGQMAAVDDLLAYFWGAADRAVFFPLPSAACAHCDYLPICGPDREGRAKEKAGDPRRAKLAELQERAP